MVSRQRSPVTNPRRLGLVSRTREQASGPHLLVSSLLNPVPGPQTPVTSQRRLGLVPHTREQASGPRLLVPVSSLLSPVLGPQTPVSSPCSLVRSMVTSPHLPVTSLRRQVPGLCSPVVVVVVVVVVVPGRIQAQASGTRGPVADPRSPAMSLRKLVSNRRLPVTSLRRPMSSLRRRSPVTNRRRHLPSLVDPRGATRLTPGGTTELSVNVALTLCVASAVLAILNLLAHSFFLNDCAKRDDRDDLFTLLIHLPSNRWD